MSVDVIQSPQLDDSAVEEFTGRLFEMFTGGLLSCMIDIGARTGLLDAAAAGPATTAELAATAGVHERYVREWAAALASAHILDYQPETRTFSLPPERAACLTGVRATNLAPYGRVVTLLATHVPGVTTCFREGGGVPYEAYRPDFTAVMDALGRGTYDELLLDAFLPVAGGLVEALRSGIRVADVGCGTGHCINLMARAFPASTFVGFDLSEEAIAVARLEAAQDGLANATFEVRDVVDLPAEPGFSAVFAFDSIHDQADPAAVLRRVQEALVPGGWFFMVDVNASSRLEDNIGNPLAPALYSVSTLHCMTVSLAVGGAGLGTMWGEELAVRMLRDAGFVDVEVHEAPGDPLDQIYLSRTTMS